jgi:phage terminase small subunit
MPKPHDLNEKQRKLVVAYLNGMSKKEAMLEAGYTDSHSRSAFQLPQVKKEIERRQRIMSTKSGVTADWIIERLKLIAGADLADMLVIYEDGTGVPDLNKLTPQLRAALSNVETEKFGDVIKMKLKLSDKLRALEMLARHLGMFNDKLEVAGELSLEERLQAGRNRTHGGEEEEKAE